MIALLFEGQVTLFLLIVMALVISLSLHEFGHAYSAKLFGDNTAQKMGRLTINPMKHIDPFGLLMVLVVGFGYAKPVPTNPQNYQSHWAVPLVAFAGPAMNLLIAVFTINVYLFLLHSGSNLLLGSGSQTFVVLLVQINLLLMAFNLIPLGVLDGHYILPYLLPRQVAQKYLQMNALYGNYALLALLLLSFAGVPVFKYLTALSQKIVPYIIFV